jgi:hypothetical protein
MLVKSKELIRIRAEIDDACDDVYSDVLHFREKGEINNQLIARMAHSHLLSAYLTLLNAIELIEELEDRE